MATGLCAGTVAVPAVASSGGAVAPAAPAPTAPATGGAALAVAPATVTVGDDVSVTGALPASVGGTTVRLQVRRAPRIWKTVASGLAAADGTFAIEWRTTLAGRLRLRAVGRAHAGAAVAATTRLLSTPQATLSVYGDVVATWYGPGFYGHHTACGEILTRHIVGVADRTLPCGTPVQVTYDGRTLVLAVIDRGPFSGPATLDLTSAAAQELGMAQTSHVSMLPLDGPPLAPTNWYPPGTGSTGATGSYAGGATAPAA